MHVQTKTIKYIDSIAHDNSKHLVLKLELQVNSRDSLPESDKILKMINFKERVIRIENLTCINQYEKQPIELRIIIAFSKLLIELQWL